MCPLFFLALRGEGEELRGYELWPSRGESGLGVSRPFSAVSIYVNILHGMQYSSDKHSTSMHLLSSRTEDLPAASLKVALGGQTMYPVLSTIHTYLDRFGSVALANTCRYPKSPQLARSQCKAGEELRVTQ